MTHAVKLLIITQSENSIAPTKTSENLTVKTMLTGAVSHRINKVEWVNGSPNKSKSFVLFIALICDVPWLK